VVAVRDDSPLKPLKPVGALLTPVGCDDMGEKAGLPNADPPKAETFGAPVEVEVVPAVGGGLVLVGEPMGGNDASNDAPNEDVG